MLEDKRIRDLTVATQTGYIRAIKRLAKCLGRAPDTATAEGLRLFQLHMANEGAIGPESSRANRHCTCFSMNFCDHRVFPNTRSPSCEVMFIQHLRKRMDQWDLYQDQALL